MKPPTNARLSGVSNLRVASGTRLGAVRSSAGVGRSWVCSQLRADQWSMCKTIRQGGTCQATEAEHDPVELRLSSARRQCLLALACGGCFAVGGKPAGARLWAHPPASSQPVRQSRRRVRRLRWLQPRDRHRRRLRWTPASGLRHVVLRDDSMANHEPGRSGRECTRSEQQVGSVRRRQHDVRAYLRPSRSRRRHRRRHRGVLRRTTPPCHRAAARGSRATRPGSPGLAQCSAAAAARVVDDAPQGRRHR